MSACGGAAGEVQGNASSGANPGLGKGRVGWKCCVQENLCKVTVLVKFIWSVFGTQRSREQVSRRAQREALPGSLVYPRPLWLRVELWREEY